MPLSLTFSTLDHLVHSESSMREPIEGVQWEGPMRESNGSAQWERSARTARLGISSQRSGRKISSSNQFEIRSTLRRAFAGSVVLARRIHLILISFRNSNFTCFDFEFTLNWRAELSGRANERERERTVGHRVQDEWAGSREWFRTRAKREVSSKLISIKTRLRTYPN